MSHLEKNLVQPQPHFELKSPAQVGNQRWKVEISKCVEVSNEYSFEKRSDFTSLIRYEGIALNTWCSVQQRGKLIRVKRKLITCSFSVLIFLTSLI